MAAISQASGSRAYAEALLDAAQAVGGTDAAREAGEALVALGAAWQADRRLRGWFQATQVKDAERQAAIARLGERLPQLVTRFLRLLLKKGRMDLLPGIADAAERILDERLGRVPVHLATAVPMAPQDVARWTADIEKATGRRAVVKTQVKPELVAGAVLRIGDWVADGSVRRRLSLLEERIIERGTR
jgi:F-type H+-transporting ATPase subunit delta